MDKKEFHNNESEKNLSEDILEQVFGGQRIIGDHHGQKVVYNVLRCKRCNGELGRTIKEEEIIGYTIPDCCRFCLEKGIISTDYYSVDEEEYY